MRSEPFVPRRATPSQEARDEVNSDARTRRARRKHEGKCINHEHRQRTHGCRCFECYLVHAYGKRRAIEMLEAATTRCAHCDQRIPHGFGAFVAEIGALHVGCAPIVFEKGNHGRAEAE